MAQQDLLHVSRSGVHSSWYQIFSLLVGSVQVV